MFLTWELIQNDIGKPDSISWWIYHLFLVVNSLSILYMTPVKGCLSRNISLYIIWSAITIVELPSSLQVNMFSVIKIKGDYDDSGNASWLIETLNLGLLLVCCLLDSYTKMTLFKINNCAFSQLYILTTNPCEVHRALCDFLYRNSIFQSKINWWLRHDHSKLGSIITISLSSFWLQFAQVKTGNKFLCRF